MVLLLLHILQLLLASYELYMRTRVPTELAIYDNAFRIFRPHLSWQQMVLHLESAMRSSNQLGYPFGRKLSAFLDLQDGMSLEMAMSHAVSCQCKRNRLLCLLIHYRFLIMKMWLSLNSGERGKIIKSVVRTYLCP